MSTFVWETAPPESQGMSPAGLDELQRILAERGTKTLLVIRNDRIVCEWYGPGFERGKRHYSASLVKALVGGVTLALALDEGCIEVDDPACNYVPVWKDDPQKSKVTIRHLATHSSGIENATVEGSTAKQDQLPGWKGAFWRREPDPFTISRDLAPIVFEPGSAFAYSNTGMAMLAYAVTASLRQGEHKDLRTLLRERIMGPIGVAPEEWSVGYGATYEVDGLPLVANWGGGSYTARAVARVGRLLLRGGDWDGTQLLASQSVERTVTCAGTPVADRSKGEAWPASGLGWWTNADGVWEGLPRDAFGGMGAGNQFLLVVPSLDLIVVRNGALLDPLSLWGGLGPYLFEPLLAAMSVPCP